MKQFPLCGFFLILSAPLLAEEEKVFSGPQPGEKLVAFKSVGVYDDLANKDFDVLNDAKDHAVVLIFMNELTRPSAALMRAITGFGDARKNDGLRTYIIWLAKDRTEAVNYLKRARKSLNFPVPVLISKDGAEGPGAYGLNRKVALTILVGKKKNVTANFALTQPSVQGDAVAIAKAIVKEIGGKTPTQAEMTKHAFPGRRPQAGGMRDPQLVGLLRQVINKQASPEDVGKAAEAVEKYIAANKKSQRELGRIANIGVQRKYGTDAAQPYLKAWAVKYGPK